MQASNKSYGSGVVETEAGSNAASRGTPGKRRGQKEEVPKATENLFKQQEKSCKATEHLFKNQEEAQRSSEHLFKQQEEMLQNISSSNRKKHVRPESISLMSGSMPNLILENSAKL